MIFLLSWSQKNSDCVLCENQISNEGLVVIIEDFVKRGQKTKLDSINSYVVLTLWQHDSLDIFSLRHANEGDLLYCHQQPIVICSPIANKKIIFLTPILKTYICGDLYGAASFYKDEYPNVYAKNREYVRGVNDVFENRGLIEETSAHISYRTLEIRFSKDGKFIDSTYSNYNCIPQNEFSEP